MAEHGNSSVSVLKDVTQNVEWMRSNNGGVQYLKPNGIALSMAQFQHNDVSKHATNGLTRPLMLPVVPGCQNVLDQQVIALNVNPNVAGYSLHSNSAIVPLSGVSNVPVCTSEPNAVHAFDSSTAYGNPHVNQISIKHLLPTSYQGNFTDEALAHAYGSYTGQHCGISARQSESPHSRSFVRRVSSSNARGDSKIQAKASNDTLVHAADANPEMHEPCPSTDGTLGTTRPGYVLNNKGMYVRGLDKQTTDATLHEMFEKFGTIVNYKVHIDPITQLCRGYGFIEFADERSAQAALDAFAMDTQQQVQVSTMRVLAPDTTNVYVRNLPVNMTEQDFEKLFAAHGKVISVRILRHENGTSQGIGFARMSTQAECEQLIASFNGYLLPGSSHPLVVKFADDSSAKRCTLKQRPRADHKLSSPSHDGSQLQFCAYGTGVQYQQPQPQPQPCQMVTAFSHQTYQPNAVPYSSAAYYSVPQFIPTPEPVEVNYSQALYNQMPNGMYQQPVATVGYQSNDSSFYTNAHSPGQIMYTTTPQHLQQAPVSSHSMFGNALYHNPMSQVVNASTVL